MDINVDLFYNDGGEEEDSIDVARLQRRLHDSSNPFDLPNSKFIRYFRLNKDAFCYLLNEIKKSMRSTIRGHTIPPILKLWCALRVFAEGSDQKGSVCHSIGNTASY